MSLSKIIACKHSEIYFGVVRVTIRAQISSFMSIRYSCVLCCLFVAGSQYPGMPSESMPNGPVGTGYPLAGPSPDYSSPLTQMTESINNISNGNSMNSVSSMNNVPQSDSSQMTHNSGQYVPVSGDQGIPILRQSDQNNMNSRMTPSSQSSQSMSNGSNQLDHQSPPSSQNHASVADTCNSIEDINLDPSAIMNDSQSTNLDVSDPIDSVIFKVN